MRTTTKIAVPAYLSFGVEVSGVRRVCPTYVRITFTGDLTDFHDGGPLGPRDMRIKLILPAALGTRPSADPDLSEDGWYRRWLTLDPMIRGHMRTYTVRESRLHQATPEIDVDFVLHLDAKGHGGPATTWAAEATVGDQLTVLGPNRHSANSGGIEWHPPAAHLDHSQAVLLAGDETACPAIASILSTLGPEYTGHALMEVPHPADIQHIPASPGVQVIWLVRGGRHHGERLKQAIEQATAPYHRGSTHEVGLPHVDVETDILWDTRADLSAVGRGELYAWVAGEAGMVRDIRRILNRTSGLARSHGAFMGYWRQGPAQAP